MKKVNEPSKESYFGCFTGDCPHETQSECNEAINSYCAELEAENKRLAECEEVASRFNADLKAENKRMEAQLAAKNNSIDMLRECGEENETYREIFTRITHTASMGRQIVEINLLLSTWKEIMRLLETKK